jgi:hypothetical protein
VKHIIHLRNKGLIKEYKFEGEHIPYYYPSQINQALKNSKRK